MENNEYFHLLERPFIVREALPQLGWDLGSALSLSSLNESFGSHRVDFYPQNMLVKPQKVYSVPLRESLEYLAYPEGAYLTVDTSEPGTYIQWNMNHSTWQTLLQQSPRSALPPALSGNMEDFFQSLLLGHTEEQRQLLGGCMARIKHGFEVRTHWFMLLLGERGAGMFCHQDSLPVGSWQAQISGAKHWKLCPPVEETAVSESGEPVSLTKAACFEATARPGDLLYYPPHFWHETLNLETPSVALSGTLVTPAHRGELLAMLRQECADQRKGYEFDADLCQLLQSGEPQ